MKKFGHQRSDHPQVFFFYNATYFFSLVITNTGVLKSMQVNDFVCISDNAYVKEQILVMEKAILGKLGWYLTVSTPYVFLVRYIKASVPNDEEVITLS